MATGFPDWTRAIVLLGWDGDNFIPVLLDDDGNLNVLMRGEDALGDLHMVRVDDSGQIIMVPRGASGNYMDVDASGFMTTVIKGDYDGDLVTVKADDQGRLSAFIIDSTDAWGNMLQIGNAELAARTGSLMTYDGRGQYQYGYDFSLGLTGWFTQALGTGALVALTPETFERGGYSVQLIAGSDGARQATCYRKIDVMQSDTFGYEAGISIAGTIEWLNIIANFHEGETLYTAGIKYDDFANELLCRTPGPAWTAFDTGIQLYHNASAFHMFKLVWNINTGKYIRCLVGNWSYDLSAYSIHSEADLTRPSMDLSTTVQGRAANNDPINLDYVVVTNQE